MRREITAQIDVPEFREEVTEQFMRSFKPIEIQDKRTIEEFLRQDPPEISEMTFTNLFMWGDNYRPRWRIQDDCLLIVLEPESKPPFGMAPVGSGDKALALESLMDALGKKTAEPRICRVPESFVNEFVDADRFEIRFDRDNSDYVYRTQDLIHLSGNKYHRKKNHVNKFKKSHDFEYRELDIELVECFLDMQETWCQLKNCRESRGLLMEDYAIYQALTHFEELDFQGAAVIIDNRVEAFTLGEPLNEDCAVIHIEKANPEIPGLYASINQLFCSNAFSNMKYINREQDMGLPGLRKAKNSYYPEYMVNKYTVTRRKGV